MYIIKMHKKDLALNNPQELRFHKAQSNQTKPNLCYIQDTTQSWFFK